MKRSRHKVAKRKSRNFKQCAFQAIVTVCFALLVFFSEVLAQSGRHPQGKPGANNEKPDVRLETLEIRVPLRAYDSNGKPVTDLMPKDVLVLEEDQARPVTSITYEPANIVLVLDLSNEIGTFKNGESRRDDLWGRPSKLVLPRPAAREFADNLVANLSQGDRIAIIQYADRVQLIQDWTENRDEALLSLKSKFRAGIKARYFDALMMAAQKLNECETGRRIVVLVSDGIDSASKSRLPQTVTALTRAQASLFVVSWTELLRNEIRKAVEWSSAYEPYNSATAKRKEELLTFIKRLDGPETRMRQMAEQSGGEMWTPSTFDKFVKTPGDVIKEISAQYTLTFVAEREGIENIRDIHVLPARIGLTVQARQKYYAEDDAR
ncbi:MAG TPA: VWA domain-containing protein [Blastocatellia bacterium]|nr:VWA domain-containing protein [Blastocatellia bacterium]